MVCAPTSFSSSFGSGLILLHSFFLPDALNSSDFSIIHVFVEIVQFSFASWKMSLALGNKKHKRK